MTETGPPLLCATDVTFGFPRRTDFLKPVRVDVDRGQCWGIIGPNGSGKSTLLRLLAGLLHPRTGAVCFDGRSLADMPLRQRARHIAFLPQHMPTDLTLTGREVVLMGRYPHRRFGLFDRAEDVEIADRALAAVEAAPFADRPLATLSGGEVQRIHVAAVMAQEPEVLLLDEPTASLDMCHQLAIFSTLRDWADPRSAVVVVTHDVNLAARFCSHVLLLNDGRLSAAGTPAEVIHPAVLGPVYGVELADAMADDPAGPWIVPRFAGREPVGPRQERRGQR